MVRLAATLVLLGACGPAVAPLRPLPVPLDRVEREHAIDQVGQRIYRALVAETFRDLLADDLALRALVSAPAATRFTARRAALRSRLGVAHGDFEPLRGVPYGGVCLQGARVEPPGSTLGLRARAWVFERALVMGVMAGGRRMGAWVEGLFVYTPHGFAGLDLGRLEAPRWEHADLELAPCDMEVGIRNPRPVVDVTD